MALPKTTKRILPDINEAVQRAASTSLSPSRQIAAGKGKGGRPSPRSGKSVRQTLLLSEETAERLTMAYAVEQVKRRKNGEKLDRSQLIEEMICSWLDHNGH